MSGAVLVVGLKVPKSGGASILKFRVWGLVPKGLGGLGESKRRLERSQNSAKMAVATSGGRPFKFRAERIISTI